MRLGFTLVLLCTAAVAMADEGMWMPSQLPELAASLEAAGLEVDAASLADLTAHPRGAVPGGLFPRRTAVSLIHPTRAS